MNWIHILDEQPENNSIIIHLDRPYESYDGEFKMHYPMGMRKYSSFLPWEDYMKYCKDRDHYPNYWWVYAKDFPFPKDKK